jgi:hypothetical protein
MSWRLALMLLACLFVAGCADSSNSSDDSHSRFGGFYGGMNGGGGMAH